MTLRELLETLRCLGAIVTLHDGDVVTIEPPDLITPALRDALAEHHAALVALVRTGPPARPALDALMTALDALEPNPSAADLAARLRTLAAGLVGADPLFRELVRVDAIARLEALGVRAPARVVDAALAGRPRDPDPGAPAGQPVLLADPDPWPETVQGAALLDEIAATYRRFVSLPDGGAEALALWVVFTYALDAFEVAPLLTLSSPLKRCGKTTTEQVTAALVRRPLPAANLTVAALYRTVDRFAPTLIVDEADTFLRDNLALRGVINSGHTRATAFVIRIAGRDPRVFSTWGARMLALIGAAPPTLGDRSIILPMRRRTPDERVERARWDRLPRLLEPLRRRAARWVADHRDALRAADPAVPEALHDRAADNWRPLLAIADRAGRAWPACARAAARTLSGTVVEADHAPAVQLLADLRDLFAATPADRLATAAIIQALRGLEDRPWADATRGQALTPRRLATLLAPFQIRPRQLRQGAATCKGYARADFDEAFHRYLTRNTRNIAMNPGAWPPDLSRNRIQLFRIEPG